MLQATYHDFLRRGAVADLSDRLKLTLTGADRVRYLNGQVTSNVSQLRDGHTQRACITTAKGRLCAEVLITATHDALWLDADPALADSLPGRLERYIVADDVALSPAPDHTRLLHFVGVDPAALAALGGQPLSRAWRFGSEGWDLWTTQDALAALWPQWSAQFAVLGEPLLETLRIEHGVPRWGRELAEDTLPPEAGLEHTHIDYHKGCYIGQEVISRLKSIGHVNRQLMGFSTQSAPLSAGLELFAPDSGDKPVGKLTSATWSFALEKPIALGYLKRGTPTHGLIARAPVASDAAQVPALPLSAQPLPFVP